MQFPGSPRSMPRPRRQLLGWIGLFSRRRLLITEGANSRSASRPVPREWLREPSVPDSN
jgi:hypothetical protein